MSVEGYPVGSAPVVTAEFRVNNVLTDPGAVVATVQSPAGVESTPLVMRVSAGVYACQFTASEAGTWHYRFTGTAPAVGAIEGDVFIVASGILDLYPAPPYTYDLATDIGKVRLYIDDRDLSSVSTQTPREQRSAIFDDNEIAQFLAGEGGSVYSASAVALTAIATNRSLLVQRRDLDGATVDYGSLRRDLLDAAAKWEAKADEVEGGQEAPADGIAEINWDEFAERRIVVNAQLREGY